jgi:hypothetical protein
VHNASIRSCRSVGVREKVSARTRPTPPLPNRYGAKGHHHCIPPSSASPQVSGRISPASTVVWTRTSSRIPHGRRRAQVRRTRLRRSQACDPNSCGPSNNTVLDTPTRYMKRASEPRFRRSEALSRTWWQVKDSNLRSFRDGFTDHRRQAGDQRQCQSPDKLPGVFPADSRRQPTSAVANRTPPRRQVHLSHSPALYAYLTDGIRDANTALKTNSYFGGTAQNWPRMSNRCGTLVLPLYGRWCWVRVFCNSFRTCSG